MTADVDVVLDARKWHAELQRPDQINELWKLIEAAILGRDLSVRPTLTLEHPDGEVRIGVARLRPGSVPVVGPHTTFQIVNLLEPARIQYRCAGCADTGEVSYGPFMCRACGTDGRGNRMCDKHVRILDGALIPTCEAHSPACAECGRPATFRCAGRCQRRTAHCAKHRVAHPNDPDLSYCPSCYADTFPACERTGCPRIGAVRCEITGPGLRACGVRICASHASRWQVYGGEAVGLGLCRRHEAELRGFPPEDLVGQIVAGTYLRSTRRRDAEPLPSLKGFAHSLRNLGHRRHALDFRWIVATLERLERQPDATGRDAEGLSRLLRERLTGRPVRGRTNWRTEAAEIFTGHDRGEELVERLRELVRRTVPLHGAAIADALRLADYRPPRNIRGEARPGLLFVHLPESYQPAFIGRGGANIKHFTAQLSALEQGGVTVAIEGDRRGGRR